MNPLAKHPLLTLAILLGSTACFFPQSLFAQSQTEPLAFPPPILNNIFLALCFLSGLIILTGVQLKGRAARRRAEQAWRECEERFRNIINASPMGVHLYRLEADGRLIFSGANPAAETILDRDNQQFIGMTIEEAFPPLAASEIPSRYREVCRTGEPWRNERFKYRCGKLEGTFEVHAFQTGPNMMASMFSDITERQQAQEALSKSEQLFRSIFESSAAAIGLATPEGDVLQVNPTACKLLDYSARELVGGNLLDIIHPADRRLARKQLAELLNGTRPVIDFENRYLHKDGSILWGHSIATCVRDESGTPLYIAGQVVNISARKQAEVALQAANRQLLGIIDFLPDATMVIDRQRRVIAWNRAMEEKTGVSKEEILGQGDYAYSLALCGERKPILIDQIANPDSLSQANYDFIDKRGEILFAERFLPTLNEGKGAHIWMKASPLRDEQGKLIGAIESIRDISVRKQAEEELHEANRELDAFAYTVAHDLRSPLTPIIGYADYLHENYRQQLSDTVLKGLSHISSSGNKMLTTMNDLLALAKTGRVKRPLEPVDTTGVVEQLIEDLAEQLAANGISIRLAALPSLQIPGSLLSQLFGNLLDNAILYAGQAGDSIEVGGTREGERVSLFVCDQGPGIPAKDRERIFDAFYRGSTGSGHEGSGIGLASVQKIAKLYGGRAWVEETPGGGSTFRVELRDSLPASENRPVEQINHEEHLPFLNA